jgi:hypothetical protein
MEKRRRGRVLELLGHNRGIWGVTRRWPMLPALGWPKTHVVLDDRYIAFGRDSTNPRTTEPDFHLWHESRKLVPSPVPIAAQYRVLGTLQCTARTSTDRRTDPDSLDALQFVFVFEPPSFRAVAKARTCRHWAWSVRRSAGSK